MTVNMSCVYGAGAQLLDDNGAILSGGFVYTYDAGTTMASTTYTSSTGGTPNSNPIVLDAAGRPSAEVWLTDGSTYKFIVRDSNGNLIRTYDDIPGVGD